MENVKILIDNETINKRIQKIANQISSDYGNEEIVIVCILKGAVYFAIDLARKIKNDNVMIDFMKISSYKAGIRESTGKIEFRLDITENIKDKNVIIVEDIIDSGNTLKFVKEHLQSKNPKTLKICVLLDKPERRIVDINADYIGFTVENKFIVGYGMDCDGKYRNLPFIGYIE